MASGYVCSRLFTLKPDARPETGSHEAKEAGLVPGMGYLGDDLGDVLQRLFDGVLGHVPLKSGDISNQVNCRGESKPSAAVYFHLHSPSIHIERTSNTTIYNVFAPFFPLRRCLTAADD